MTNVTSIDDALVAKELPFLDKLVTAIGEEVAKYLITSHPDLLDNGDEETVLAVAVALTCNVMACGAKMQANELCGTEKRYRDLAKLITKRWR